MNNRCVILAMFGFGFQLLIAGLALLITEKDGLKYHRNPFAIQQSGYGKTLARLSQDTVNVVWHLGIEQVNPVGHDHSHCDHDHGHCDHEHSSEAEKEIAAEFAKLGKKDGEEASHHDHEGGHGDHVPAELTEAERQELVEAGIDPEAVDCRGCAETLLDSIRKGQTVAMEDLPAIHAFHELADSGAGEHDHDYAHAHGDHEHDHEHLAEAGAGESGFDDGLLAHAKDWLQDLTAASYERTSPFAVSEAHQKAIAADIEKMLLRAYKMDPTDFGVYNGYFLFLTVHEFRATPVSREHAKMVSRMTMMEAEKEEVDPQPWQTASMALLNLFFLEQQDYEEKGETPPVAMLEEFKQRMDYYQHRFRLARERAKAEGRWDLISEARRDAMEERERFALIAGQQFDVMIARAESPEDHDTRPGGASEGPAVKLGNNSEADNPSDGSDL